MKSSLLLFCIESAFLITGIYGTMLPGMFLFWMRQRIGRFLYTHGMETISKPVYDCLPCMVSVWGSLYWLLAGRQYNIVPYLLITSGILKIIDGFMPSDRPIE